MKKNDSPQTENNLTPWQREHERYLARKKEREAQNEQSEGLSSQDTESVEGAADTQQVDAVIEEEVKFEEHERNTERISFMDKLPRLHSYHHKRMMKRIGLIVGVLFIPLVISIFFVSPFSKLHQVTISGNKRVSSEEILKSSQFQLNEGFFKQYHNKDAAIQAIKDKNPRIKSVNVSISRFNSLKVAVTEFPEIAQLQKKGKFYVVLASGKILKDPHNEALAGLVTLEKFENDYKIMQTITALSKLPSSIQSGVSQITFAPTKSAKDLLNIFMNDGNKVIVSISNLTSQMTYYPQIVKDIKDPGIIDMQVGIFYSPYPSSEEETTGSSDEEGTQSSAESIESESSSSSANE